MQSTLTPRQRWTLAPFLAFLAAFLLAGCSDSTVDKSSVSNPLSALQAPTTSTGLPTNGQTTTPGQIDQPIVSIPVGSDGRNDHTNAPLLDNWHPGWQQGTCFSCHNDQSRIPDHSYPDTSLCYLCHGTNGLPGFGDNIPPVIKGVQSAPAKTSVFISWSTDELCTCRLIIRTKEGDRLEFPVSGEHSTSHKFTVSGLLPNTAYTFEVIATDKNNNVTSTSALGALSFSTLQ